jgi:hypothetical protein
MWKPGSDGPSPRSRSPSRSPPPAVDNNGDASPSDKKAGKKRLSSGTMGMRFMKRKAEAAEAAKQQAAEEEQAKAEREAMEWTTRGGVGGASATSGDDDAMVPLTATASDVYGIGAAIIGRRSFGNFNKAVEDTWAEAIESKSRERAGARAEKQQITDEELLQRYEKYVRGEGDMSGGGKSSSIGNLQKKRKKKRKNHEGGDKRRK